MSIQPKIQDINSPISVKSQLDFESPFLPKSPMKARLELDKSPKRLPTITSLPPIKTPSQNSIKLLVSSPTNKLSKNVTSVILEEDELRKSRKPSQVIKTEGNQPNPRAWKTMGPAVPNIDYNSDKYDYHSQLLMYIPENFRSLSIQGRDSPFNSFNELSLSTKNSHPKLLNNILHTSGGYDDYYSEEKPVHHKSKFATLEKVLELNKLQKKYYSHQIEAEKKEHVLPLIKMVRKEKEKSLKMPHVKVLPSRRLYYGNNIMDLLNNIGTPEAFSSPFIPEEKKEPAGEEQKLKRASKSSKVAEEKPEEKPIILFNYKFFWNFIQTNKTAWRPGGREGHTFTTVGKWIILYGGISSQILDEIILYDPAKNLWSKPTVTGETPRSGRHGHSAVEFKKTLVIFGGEQAFNPTLNFRECLNDVYMFSLEKNEWKYLKSTSHPANPRRYHAASVYGRYMYIYGGVSNEGKFTRDVWTFDLKICTWHQVEVDGDKEIGMAFHAMATCYVDKTSPNYLNKDKSKLLEEGLYVFGGKDHEGKILNTLKFLPVASKRPSWRYPVTKGVAPTARFNHSLLFYEPLGILIVYGGRNDSLYGTSQDVCLNDIRILNIEQMAWSPITSYGNVPEVGRYHHGVSTFGSKMYIFGGVGLQQFVDDEVKSVELNQAEVNKLVKVHYDFSSDNKKEKTNNNNNNINKNNPQISISKDQKKVDDSSKPQSQELSIAEFAIKSKNFVSWQPLPLGKTKLEEETSPNNKNKKKKKKGSRKAFSKMALAEESRNKFE